MPIDKNILRDYIATANSGKYGTIEEVNSKFPELKDYDTQLLKDYLATANSGKYSTLDEVNGKFPEFFQEGQKKKPIQPPMVGGLKYGESGFGDWRFSENTSGLASGSTKTTTPSVSTKGAPKTFQEGVQAVIAKQEEPTNLDFKRKELELWKGVESQMQTRVNKLREAKQIEQTLEVEIMPQIEALKGVVQNTSLPMRERQLAQDNYNQLVTQAQELQAAGNKAVFDRNAEADRTRQTIAEIDLNERLRQSKLQKDYNPVQTLVDGTLANSIRLLNGIREQAAIVGLAAGGQVNMIPLVSAQSDEMSEKVREFADSLITQEAPASFSSFFDGDNSPKEIAAFAANAIASTVPTVAAGLLGGAPAAIAAGAGLMYEESYEAMKDAGLSGMEAKAAAFGIGVPLGLLDAYGVSDIINAVGGKRIIGEIARDLAPQIAGKNLTKEQIFQAAKKSFGEKLKGFSSDLYQVAKKEPVTEMQQALVSEGGKQLAEAYTGKDSDMVVDPQTGVKRPMTSFEYAEGLAENVATEGLGGLVGGVTLGSIPAAYKAINSPSAYKLAMGLRGEAFEDFLEDLDVEVESGILSREEANQAITNVLAIQEASKLIPKSYNLGEDAVVEATNLLIEKKGLEKSIEGADPAMSAPIKEQIKALDERLINLSTFALTGTAPMSVTDVKPSAEDVAANDLANEGVTEGATEQVKSNIVAVAQETLAKSLPIVQGVLGRMNNAEYINDNDIKAAEDEIYGILDEVDKREDLSPEQKSSVFNLIEPLLNNISNYEFRTKTETVKTTEKRPIESARGDKAPTTFFTPAEGAEVELTLPNGDVRRGTLSNLGGEVVISGGGKQIRLGVPEVSGRGITLDETTSKVIENPALSDVKATTVALNSVEDIIKIIEDKTGVKFKDANQISNEYHKAKNNQRNPSLVSAINELFPSEEIEEGGIVLDPETGNIASVTVVLENGSKLKVTSPEQALDLAIRIRAQEVGEVPPQIMDEVMKQYEDVEVETTVETPYIKESTPTQEVGEVVSSGTSPQVEVGGENVKFIDEKTGQNDTTSGINEPVTPPIAPDGVQSQVTPLPGEGESQATALPAEQAKSLANKIRSLKSGGGRAYDASIGLPIAIYDFAIETVAKAVEGGATIVDAVEQALAYIKENYKGSFDKNIFIYTVFDIIDESEYVVEDSVSLSGVKYSDIVVGDKYLNDILDENKLSKSEKDLVKNIFSRYISYFKFDNDSEKRFQEKFINPEDINDVSDLITGLKAAQESAFAAYNDRNYENIIDQIRYIVSNPSQYSSKVVKTVKEIKEKLDNPNSSFERLYAIDVLSELGVKAQSNSAQKDLASKIRALKSKSGRGAYSATSINSSIDEKFKKNIVGQIESFFTRGKSNETVNALEFAYKILPKNVFNKYKSLYELAAKNNVTISGGKPDGYNFIAEWSYGSIRFNSIFIKYNLNNYDDFASVLNHEIIHGLLSYGIRDNYSLNKSLQVVMNNVFDRYEDAPQNIKNIIDYIKETSLNFTEENYEGGVVGSLEELITYAFTDKDFAEFLDSIPASTDIKYDGNSIFNQLKDIIRKFINSLSNSSTSLDEINSILNEFFDTSFREGDIKNRNKDYGWGLFLDLKTIKEFDKAYSSLVNNSNGFYPPSVIPYINSGLIFHGGKSKIESFDPEKIVGGFRGELGFGFYFGASSKPYDYGSEMTYVDSNKLNLLDGDQPLPSYDKDKLFVYYKNMEDSDNISDMQKGVFAKKILDYIESHPSSSIRNVILGVAFDSPSFASKLLSQILVENGFDGMQVSDKWQVVLYPSDKLNSLIVSDPNYFTARAYIAAKETGNNPKLVNSVEKLKEKSIADKVRSFKSKNRGMYDATIALPLFVYDGFLEVVARAIERGLIPSEIIREGLAYLDRKRAEGAIPRVPRKEATLLLARVGVYENNNTRAEAFGFKAPRHAVNAAVKYLGADPDTTFDMLSQEDLEKLKEIRDNNAKVPDVRKLISKALSRRFPNNAARVRAFLKIDPKKLGTLTDKYVEAVNDLLKAVPSFTKMNQMFDEVIASAQRVVAESDPIRTLENARKNWQKILDETNITKFEHFVAFTRRAGVLATQLDKLKTMYSDNQEVLDEIEQIERELYGEENRYAERFSAQIEAFKQETASNIKSLSRDVAENGSEDAKSLIKVLDTLSAQELAKAKTTDLAMLEDAMFEAASANENFAALQIINKIAADRNSPLIIDELSKTKNRVKNKTKSQILNSLLTRELFNMYNVLGLSRDSKFNTRLIKPLRNLFETVNNSIKEDTKFMSESMKKLGRGAKRKLSSNKVGIIFRYLDTKFGGSHDWLGLLLGNENALQAFMEDPDYKSYLPKNKEFSSIEDVKQYFVDQNKAMFDIKGSDSKRKNVEAVYKELLSKYGENGYVSKAKIAEAFANDQNNMFTPSELSLVKAWEQKSSQLLERTKVIASILGIELEAVENYIARQRMSSTDPDSSAVSMDSLFNWRNRYKKSADSTNQRKADFIGAVETDAERLIAKNIKEINTSYGFAVNESYINRVINNIKNSSLPSPVGEAIKERVSYSNEAEFGKTKQEEWAVTSFVKRLFIMQILVGFAKPISEFIASPFTLARLGSSGYKAVLSNVISKIASPLKSNSENIKNLQKVLGSSFLNDPFLVADFESGQNPLLQKSKYQKLQNWALKYSAGISEVILKATWYPVFKVNFEAATGNEFSFELFNNAAWRADNMLALQDASATTDIQIAEITGSDLKGDKKKYAAFSGRTTFGRIDVTGSVGSVITFMTNYPYRQYKQVRDAFFNSQGVMDSTVKLSGVFLENTMYAAAASVISPIVKYLIASLSDNDEEKEKAGNLLDERIKEISGSLSVFNFSSQQMLQLAVSPSGVLGRGAIILVGMFGMTWKQAELDYLKGKLEGKTASGMRMVNNPQERKAIYDEIKKIDAEMLKIKDVFYKEYFVTIEPLNTTKGSFESGKTLVRLIPTLSAVLDILGDFNDPASIPKLANVLQKVEDTGWNSLTDAEKSALIVGGLYQAAQLSSMASSGYRLPASAEIERFVNFYVEDGFDTAKERQYEEKEVAGKKKLRDQEKEWIDKTLSE